MTSDVVRYGSGVPLHELVFCESETSAHERSDKETSGPFEPRRQIRIFKPSALHTLPWCWARTAAWLNEAVRSHRTVMTKKHRGFRPPRCKSHTCIFRPSYCITKDDARLWWKHNKCLFGCVPLEHPPGQQTQHDIPICPRFMALRQLCRPP